MDTEEARRIWERFMTEGILDDRMQPVVARSWKKCREFGVDPYSSGGTQVGDDIFQDVLRKNKVLMHVAGPVMQSVYKIIKESHFLLALADRNGYVLRTIGDDAIIQRSENILLRRGSVWSNTGVGSNAPGIALEYNMPIQMNGAEHYCLSQHTWTCSAAPIHGVNGSVIGCLDLSGSVEAAHPHTLALVVACAFSIESMLASYHQTLIMRSAANGLHEAILLLDETFHLRWSNYTAKKELAISLPHMAQVDFRQVMPNVDWAAVLIEKEDNAPTYVDDMRFVLNGRVRRFSATISCTADATGRTITIILRKQEHFIRSVNRVSGNQAIYTFDSIFAADPVMRQVVGQARQYARYDGSVLIEGESGKGKELFAQAIHTGSHRAGGPFVAVNCASLPRDLIESELFGYEKGAFTGALKEGNPGKFELANYGTLFLDEIGEMPMEFQAKLLRAVETLRIRRIGGKEEKKLDVRVIAATNRNLKRQVRLGSFRGDLYYRLNVLKLDIPPLRERPADIQYCARLFLERFNERYPAQRKTLSPDSLSRLTCYDWPGNVRELQNCIERAFYMSGGPVISKQVFRDMLEDAATRTHEAAPSYVRTGTNASSSEGEQCLLALEKTGGSVNAAAASIGVSRATFYRLCRTYGIEPKKIRRSLKL